MVDGDNEVFLHDEVSSDGYVYVDARKSGTATIRVLATKGGKPAGMKDVSLTIAAPHLRFASGTYYGNPDGGEIHTNTNGYGGNAPSATYYTTPVSGGAPFSVQSTSSSTTLAVGFTLAADIYSEFLEPVYSVQNSSPYACLGKADGKVCVTSLTGYPSTSGASLSTGVVLGKLNANAKASTTGVSQVQANVYAVNPFASVGNEGAKSDLDDHSAVASYVSFTGTTDRGTLPMPSISSTEYRGFQVVVNPSVSGGSDISGQFEMSVSSLRWNKNKAKTHATHRGGYLSYRVTVKNRHSSETIYREYATGRMFVHGALGPVLTQNGSGNYIVYAAAVGNTASYMNVETSLESSVRFIRMTGSGPLNQTFTYNGQSYQVVSVSEASGGFTSFIGYSTPIYSFSLSPATPSVAPIYYIDKLPAFIDFFNPGETMPPGTVYDASSSSDPVFYLVGTSGESWYNSNKGYCGFYIIHLLGNITTSQTWAGAD